MSPFTFKAYQRFTRHIHKEWSFDTVVNFIQEDFFGKNIVHLLDNWITNKQIYSKNSYYYHTGYVQLEYVMIEWL